MSEFSLSKLREEFDEKEYRIPISSWNLTGALDQIHTNDPFSWNSYNSSNEFSDVQKEINEQYCQEVDLITKLAFPSNSKSNQGSPNDHDEKNEKHWQRTYQAMKLWEKHVSPIIIKNGKAHIILPPRYVREPAKIKTLSFDKFANDMVVHCAALKNKVRTEQKTNEKKNLAIFALTVLLIITYFFF